MNVQPARADENKDLPALEHGRPWPDSWLVLIVDDEAEVHEVTKLVLSKMTFCGIPVELHSAYSAVEAEVFLESHPDTALLLLDVVMESDVAGLRLIKRIREEMLNTDLQIILRTGQPGMAPERDVIPSYEVNGYFLKTEMVAQKLQSIVVSSLRAFRYIRMLKRRHRGDAAAKAQAADVRLRPLLDQQFAAAIDGGAVQLLAQLQFRLETGRVEGVEIVPTWRNDDAVIGIAQLAEWIVDPELCLKFDAWLLGQGSAWMRSWSAPGRPDLRISLPVLTRDLAEPRLLSLLEQRLTTLNLRRSSIDLMVPAAVFFQERADRHDAFARLKELGVSVTLVDFGFDLFSLPRLQRVPPDRLKIHRAFVRNVAQHLERSAIARSVIALAHTLGVTVIADGMASERDLQFFKWEGCDVGQGDFLAKTMIVADVSGALASGTSAKSANADLH